MSTAPRSVGAPGGPVRLALLVGPETMRHIGRIVRHLTIGLLDELFSVTVVADAAADVSPLPSPPIEVLRSTRTRLPFRRRQAVEMLSGQLAEQGAELLHALDASALPLTQSLAKALDVPCLVSITGLNEWRRLASPDAHLRAVLPASVPLRARLLSRLSLPPEIVQVVRPGVHQVRQPGCLARAGRSPAVIVAGDLDTYEPFAAALRAFASLRKAEYECLGFIIGNGRAEHRLRAQAEALHLMHQLTFVDRPAPGQMAGIFGSADIFVFPQSSGALEVEVLEAMAAGVPVLVGGPCVGDFVIDGETALSYAAADPADLMTKLRHLLDHQDSALQLTAGALAYLRENHSPARMVAALADLYRAHALAGRTLQIS